MTSLLRILAGKGGCPPSHATVTVPSVQPGCRRPEEIAVTAADGSEGTVPIPPDAAPGQTLRVVVPSAYPNWGPGSTTYSGDWVATYAAGAHAPGRGMWATERISPHIHSDPGFVLRQAQIDGGDPPDAAAERFRRAAERRNAALTLAAKQHHTHTAGDVASPGGQGNAALDELRERNAEVVRLHADLVDAAGIDTGASAKVPAQSVGIDVGRPDSVVAAVERLRTGMVEGTSARSEALEDLRFVCRQNMRQLEREHQSAAGGAGAIELLCEMIAGEQLISVGEEERAAATWLLAQLCFKHQANCVKFLACSKILHVILCQANGGQLRVAQPCATDKSGLRAAAFSLLGNLASHGPDGTTISMVQAGAVGVALTVLAAHESSGALRPKLETPSSDESDSDDEMVGRGFTWKSSVLPPTLQPGIESGMSDAKSGSGAPREPELVQPHKDVKVDLGLVLKAAIMLESLANCDECRSDLIAAGVPAALRPLAAMSGLSTGHLPGRRVPFAGASLGAVAARALADL